MAKRKSNNILTKDAFLKGGSTLERKLVPVPQFNGSVWVRQLSGKSLLSYNEYISELQAKNPQINASNSVDLMALLISYTVCDEDGNLLFAKEDAEKLAENSLDVLLLLSSEAMKVSGVSTEAIDEVKNKLKNEMDSSSSITN